MITTQTPAPPQWRDASVEHPDADMAVLAINAAHDAYWIATYDGQDWVNADDMRILRVTHWMDLPDAPAVS